MELVRLILINAEINDHSILGYTPEEVAYHVALMRDANLLEAAISRNGNGLPYRSRVTRLTWQGHEFLEATRNPKIWAATMEKASDLGLSAIGTCLLEIAKGFVA